MDIENSSYLNFKDKSELSDSITRIEPVSKSIDVDICDLSDKKDLCSEFSYLEDERYLDMFNHFNQAFNILNDLYNSKGELNKTISICDLATLNSLHKLELGFDKLNACQVFYEGKKLNSIRNKRRIAKDKKLIVESLYDSYQLFYDSFNALLSNLESREYHERGTHGMFDDDKLKILDSNTELKKLVDSL